MPQQQKNKTIKPTPVLAVTQFKGRGSNRSLTNVYATNIQAFISYIPIWSPPQKLHVPKNA